MNWWPLKFRKEYRGIYLGTSRKRRKGQNAQKQTCRKSTGLERLAIVGDKKIKYSRSVERETMPLKVGITIKIFWKGSMTQIT